MPAVDCEIEEFGRRHAEVEQATKRQEKIDTQTSDRPDLEDCQT